MSVTSLVSVVFPFYNEEKYIGTAIESIINQSYKHLEILMINDGSTDRTPEIVNSYAEKDSRIKVINIPINKGLINSLNTGIAAATGEYIARMDADDISAPDRIEKTMNAFNENPEIELICAANCMINVDGKVLICKVPKATSVKAIKFVAFFVTPVVHGCVMAKSWVFKENPFNMDYIHSEDYELFSRLCLKGVKMLNLTEPLYFLRLNPGSVSFRYEIIQVSNHGKISMQNIESYFNISLDFFLHNVMINRISFDVKPSLAATAFNQLKILKSVFVQREECKKKEIEEIEHFLIEQKMDILLQSFKYSRMINKIGLLFLMLVNVNLFFNKRGFQYFRAKIHFKARQ
jgi:glycosyltransferase involved in cell wall biosynthesis